MSLFSVNVYHHVVCPDPPGGPNGFEILRAEIQSLKETLMASMTELAAELGAITAAVGKVEAETRTLISKIADLEAAVAAAGNTTPEVDAALAALRAQVEIVDGLVPDAPPPPEEPAP